MNKAEILAMKPGPELDGLVHVQVMGGKCWHLKRRPVNPDTIRHSNAAKEICEGCGWRTYTSDFRYAEAKTRYSRDIWAAREVVYQCFRSVADWNRFFDALEEVIRAEGAPVTTSTVIQFALNPLAICQAALISKLEGGAT
jgi:hypothetical protein